MSYKMADVQCDICHIKWLGCNAIYFIQNGWGVMRYMSYKMAGL